MIAELPAEITHDVVGRHRELHLLLSALGHGKAVLLIGLPGVSKTTMVRALAHHLGSEPDRFVDVTGDEQLTAHALVGTFDPPMVLKDGYRPEHFIPGPLTRAMSAGGILYVEEMNRAPSGALNALMTALSEGYIEIPRLGRIEAAAGFTVIGAANPLDDVGTARLSRGLVDRFVLLELDYQPRDEELEIVARRSGTERRGLHSFAVDIGRESRKHPDLRHGASVRGAIDFVDLLSGYDFDKLDLDTLRFLGCSAYAGKLRVRPTVNRSACAIVHDLIDLVLERDYHGDVTNLLEQATLAPMGDPLPARARATPTSPSRARSPWGEAASARRPKNANPMRSRDCRDPGVRPNQESRARCRWSTATGPRLAGAGPLSSKPGSTVTCAIPKRCCAGRANCCCGPMTARPTPPGARARGSRASPGRRPSRAPSTSPGPSRGS
ncbi:MAG: AAA domain-containing protein [Actinobacteria bacterium]|nr:AAA domain-containing protein [Actinomycetota bacterium]